MSFHPAWRFISFESPTERKEAVNRQHVAQGKSTRLNKNTPHARSRKPPPRSLGSGVQDLGFWIDTGFRDVELRGLVGFRPGLKIPQLGESLFCLSGWFAAGISGRVSPHLQSQEL